MIISHSIERKWKSSFLSVLNPTVALSMHSINNSTMHVLCMRSIVNANLSFLEIYSSERMLMESSDYTLTLLELCVCVYTFG